jgi:hypothetical protein
MDIYDQDHECKVPLGQDILVVILLWILAVITVCVLIALFAALVVR